MTKESHANAALALQELLQIVAKLRDPQGGCPWDLKQTFASLRPLLIGEAYEVSDAVEEGDLQTCEELGDLLSIVALYAQIGEETSRFSFASILEAISKKLVRRHPHVFGDVKVSSATEVLKNWESIKEQERKETDTKKGLLDGLPRSLPALQRSHEIGERCARVGFDWTSSEAVAEKVREELHEFLQEALEANSQTAACLPASPSNANAEGRIFEEFGDLLFSLCQYSRHLGFNAEEALTAANRKFCKRFKSVEDLAELETGQRSVSGLSTDTKESLWQKAKKIVG